MGLLVRNVSVRILLYDLKNVKNRQCFILACPFIFIQPLLI